MPLVEWYPAEQRAEQSGLAGSVRAGHGDPVRPVDLQVDRAEGERAAPDDGAAECGDDRSVSGCCRDFHPEVPFFPGFVDDVEALDQPLGLAGLRGLFLGGFGAELAADLVVVGLFAAGVLDALFHPGALRPGPLLQTRPRAGVLRLVGTGGAPGQLALRRT